MGKPVTLVCPNRAVVLEPHAYYHQSATHMGLPAHPLRYWAIRQPDAYHKGSNKLSFSSTEPMSHNQTTLDSGPGGHCQLATNTWRQFWALVLASYSNFMYAEVFYYQANVRYDERDLKRDIQADTEMCDCCGGRSELAM